MRSFSPYVDNLSDVKSQDTLFEDPAVEIPKKQTKKEPPKKTIKREPKQKTKDNNYRE